MSDVVINAVMGDQSEEQLVAELRTRVADLEGEAAYFKRLYNELLEKFVRLERGFRPPSSERTKVMSEQLTLDMLALALEGSAPEGVEFPAPENLPELSLSEKTDRARAIVAGMPSAPDILEGAEVACYRPATDSVHMPEARFFTGGQAYYSTLFHELAHSTGHTSRLARKTLLVNRDHGADVHTALKNRGRTSPFRGQSYPRHRTHLAVSR
jgi:hypothetical protein